MIERTSPVPYYEQLFAILKQRIVDGDFQPGARLPSELDLCREFGLSRATVRQTLSKLESEGFVHRVPRRGVFASAPAPATGWILQDVEGFLESQIRHGRTGVKTSVITAGFVAPPVRVAEELRLEPGERTFAIERVRSLDGRIALFSTNWFPRDVGQAIATADEVLDGSGSVNAALRRTGFVTDAARRVIHAMGAPERIAAHLGVDPGHAVLRIRSLSWDRSGRRFDAYETWLLTDTVPLEINVTAG